MNESLVVVPIHEGWSLNNFTPFQAAPFQAAPFQTAQVKQRMSYWGLLLVFIPFGRHS